MGWLVGLVFAIGALWLWLAGHWFGRILAFLAFSVLFIIAITPLGNPAFPLGVAVLCAVAVGAAWFASGIPTKVLMRFTDPARDCSALRDRGAAMTSRARSADVPSVPRKLERMHSATH